MTKEECLMGNPMIVLREEFDDWALLFDPDSNVAYGLNPVGVLIWKMLDGKHGFKDIVSAVNERCEGGPQNVEADIKSFLQSLIQAGFAGRIKE